MNRTRLLLATVGTGVVLSAVAVPTAVFAVNSGESSKSTASSAPSNGNEGNGRTCGYPSNRTPNITLSAQPTTIRRGAQTVLSGMMSGNGCGIKGKVGLYAQTNRTGPYRLVDEETAANNGSFTFDPQKPAQTTNYKATFAGDNDYDPVSSNVVTVTVTAR